MYQIVQTNRSTYLCSAVEEKEGKVILTEAFDMPASSFDIDEAAKVYLRAKINGHLRPIRISPQNVESIQDLEELDALLKTYISQIPLAKRKAEAKLILEELAHILDS